MNAAIACAFALVVTTFVKSAGVTPQERFAFPMPRETGALVVGDEPLSHAEADEYIGFYEYYFEMRLAPADRTAYKALIARKWRTDTAFRRGLRATSEAYRATRAMPYLEASRLRTQRRAAGSLEQTMLAAIGGAAQQPTEVLNQIRSLAQGGDEEARWLLRQVETFEAPVVTSMNILARPFTRQHVDALVDLLVFRANAVAGALVIEASEAMRDSMRDFLIAQWNKDAARQPDIYLWLTDVKADWQAIEHAERAWPHGAITPYQRHRVLRDWAQQTRSWFPALARSADARLEQYRLYVARMSPAEMSMELGLVAQSAAVAQQAAQSLRNQITAAHVVNLNGIEGLGGGRVWEYRLLKGVPAAP